MTTGDKIHRRALTFSPQHEVFIAPVKLPEGAMGVTFYGSGLPKSGVYISKEEIDAGIVGVDAGPGQGLPTVGG